MSSSKFLSRGIDYLGDLGAKLRDLQGYSTLANELIQNADDAANATSISFDVGDDAFVVDNDGVFSDCGTEESECPWKTDELHGHRCDFHRFRHIAAGDKRGQADTTGAFGIGFIATYQVTDMPELISVGRHWALHEDSPEDERIEVCSGCSKCVRDDLPGTRFIFPWARDADSDLRRALRAEPVSSDGPERMVEELLRSLPVAMLFLRRLRKVQVKRSGRTIRTLERLDESNSLILSDGSPENDQIWHLIRGEFSTAADGLRDRHHGRIEAKRSAEVTLAIPATALRDGLLCACLPTEQETGLPFHINADFFPTNDRKRVILAGDFQSEWNREALRAAGRAIGDAVGILPALLGAHRFWGLISTLKEVADKALGERGEPVLAEFWRQVLPKLRTAPVVQTSRGEWTFAANTCLLSQREEVGVIGTLEALGVRVVNESIRRYQGLLRETLGIPLLDVERICDTLVAAGLDRRTAPSDMPGGLDVVTNRVALYSEIALLLDRHQRTHKVKEDDERRLRDVALAPGRDGAFWPCRDIFSADASTIALFQQLDLGIPFVADDQAFAPLVVLCPSFTATAAIEAFEQSGTRSLEERRHKGALLRNVFDWFENRRQEILANGVLARRLAALSIFPSGAALRPLESLALPGYFSDPLGLAELVDLSVLGGRREFLRDLGMPQLDFKTYAGSRLPIGLSNPTVTSDKRRAAIRLLAGRVGELKDDPSARLALAAAPLVECVDGAFRRAQDCYFDSPIVRACLGGARHFAVPPDEHKAATRDLLAWLGVSTEPRLDDIASSVRALAAQPYSSSLAQQVQKIVEHLAGRVEGKDAVPELRCLKTERWLPARGRADRWYRADELFAAYQDYLFDTQADFIDLNPNTQRMGRALFEFLGVHITPTPNLVVKHLLHCARAQIPVKTVVYRFLNENHGDPSLGQLKDKKCLCLGDTYHAPNDVFWSEHPFGPYRWRLGEDLRSYGDLLIRLGVRETPNYRDALAVLREISAVFGATNTALDDDSHAVLMSCWRMLDQALRSAGTTETEVEALQSAVAGLRSTKCVPKPSRVLNPPEWMFFENRAGLASKFGEYLAGNVISRPVDAGAALTMAGVRMLGTAVETELLERGDPREDREMAERIGARRDEMGRVLDARGSEQGTAAALSRLAGIQCQAADFIEIRYRLTAFNSDLYSPAEQVPALYQREEDTLSYTRREGQVPWAAIARELAIALSPEEDPGRFAAGLKEALSPESAAEAMAVLDELGFARLDTVVPEASTNGAAAGRLGTDVPAEADFSGDVPYSEVKTESLDTLTPEEALRRILGHDAPPLTLPVPQPPEPIGILERVTGHKTTIGGKQKRRPVLRSYVPSPEEAVVDDVGDADDDAESRSPVDEAGVSHVMTHEAASARVPKEMPHQNPGYDIESRDATGKIVRYIEVKSLSGEWRYTYAVLSREQFGKARDLGDLFWLYVVERALSDDFKIYRIQNPALRANHFMFDDGWSALAEAVPMLVEGN